jgi:hypothetical protein
MDSHGVKASSNLIWHKHVPLKVSVLAWRLLRNKLPTKDNLATRNIISHDSQVCMTGCGGLETTWHLFLLCDVFAPLWGLLRSWIDIYSAGPELLHDYLVQFTHTSGGSCVCRWFLQLNWLCCIWVMWSQRNNRVFKAKENTIHQILDKVKLHSLMWLKAYNANNIGVNSHIWWQSSFVCLSIG